MRRFELILGLFVVCTFSAGVGLIRPATAEAGQELTAVQQAFVARQPLTMRIEPVDQAPRGIDFRPVTSVDQGAQTAPPTAAKAPAAAVTFKKATIPRVILYGLQLQFYEHVMRIAAQHFTRVELKGPFFQDWFDSVHVPHQWGDQDSWEVNYIGHAIHGSAFVRIWLDQREPKPATKKQYFQQLGRAFIYAALLSEQYEIGPMSEASIGNVGLHEGRTGWVDHIWTPVGGLLWAMAEDGIDKYFLAFVDKHVPFLMARAAARMILNPGRMLANIGENRVPWSRPDRPISAGLPGR